MNRTDSESMTLAEGNALRVSWQIESYSPMIPEEQYAAIVNGGV